MHSGWYDAWDPATQTLEFTLRIRSTRRRRAAPETLRAHRVHLFTPDELAGLLAAAGLEQIEVAGGFDGSPLSPRLRASRSTAAGRPHERAPCCGSATSTRPR